MDSDPSAPRGHSVSGRSQLEFQPVAVGIREIQRLASLRDHWPLRDGCRLHSAFVARQQVTGASDSEWRNDTSPSFPEGAVRPPRLSHVFQADVVMIASGAHERR